MRALDLFSGAGGWDLALTELGVTDIIGVDNDPDVCATRHAAGLLTIRADLAILDPATIRGPIDGICGSPPCPDFSAAGKRTGLNGTTGRLVYVPLRWVEHHRPQWVALEQVPEVAPIWRTVARRLEELGYSTWSGVLCAADYGTPQKRRRAILMASLASQVTPPAPTHTRHPHPTLDGAAPLHRWVSMAEALEWGLTEEPSGTVVAGSEDGGRHGLDGGSGARRTYRAAQTSGGGHGDLTLSYRRGQGMTDRHGERPDHDTDGPAPTISTHGRNFRWLHTNRGQTAGGGGGAPSDRHDRLRPLGHRQIRGAMESA